VVNQSHPTINSLNPSFAKPNTHLILTVDSAQFGLVRATTVSERPSLAPALRSVKVGNTYKFDSLSKLSMWGSIYSELVVPEKPYFQRKMVKKVRVFIQQSVENGF